MASAELIPAWADPNEYWQGWWAAHYDLPTQTIGDGDLDQLIKGHDGYAFGYRDGLKGVERV